MRAERGVKRLEKQCEQTSLHEGHTFPVPEEVEGLSLSAQRDTAIAREQVAEEDVSTPSWLQVC